MRLILHVDGADRSADADADVDVDDAAAAATSIPTSLAVVVVDMDWRRFTSTLCQCHLFCSLLTRTPFSASITIYLHIRFCLHIRVIF